MTNAYYTDSHYTFAAATPKRKYIKYLEQIAKCNANGFNPTRKQVQIALGDPDPSAPNEYRQRRLARCRKHHKRILPWMRARSNWGISRWTAMKQAGLIRAERVGNTVRYQITADGILLLHSVV